MDATSPLIDANELASLKDDPSCVIVDCRFNLLQPDAGHEAYIGGHIPGARYAHLDDDLARVPAESEGRHPLPDPEVFADRLGRWGIDNDSIVVAYDDSSGAIAARLWWMLRWLNHDKVFVLDGGLKSWLGANFPLESGETQVEKRRFDYSSSQESWVVETTALGSEMASGCKLLDARSPERFNGHAEPIDPVAGHIPGASNLPFNSNLDADGKFLSANEIKSRMSTIAPDPHEPPIVMCGSGVTACHLLLAMAHAGMPLGRLYVGSWSEWIRDPNRPIAKDTP